MGPPMHNRVNMLELPGTLSGNGFHEFHPQVDLRKKR